MTETPALSSPASVEAVRDQPFVQRAWGVVALARAAAATEARTSPSWAALGASAQTPESEPLLCVAPARVTDPKGTS